MLDELKEGMPSYVSPDINAAPQLSDDEIRERMSGNLCRCGAYVNIVAAIREVGQSENVSVANPIPVGEKVGVSV